MANHLREMYGRVVRGNRGTLSTVSTTAHPGSTERTETATHKLMAWKVIGKA